MDRAFILEGLSALTKVGLFEMSPEGNLRPADTEGNPISQCEPLRRRLAAGCRAQRVPYIVREEDGGILWAAVDCGDGGCVLCGPVALYPMSAVETRRFYRAYHIPEDEERHIPQMTLADCLLLIRYLCCVLLDTIFDDAELVRENSLPVFEAEGTGEGMLLHDLHDDATEHLHHTYRDERKIAEYLQKGDYESVYHWNYQLIQDGEPLSGNRRVHWYNMAIVAITLCTRAAIEGGLPALRAYRLSGYYIGKLDIHDDVLQTQNVLNTALLELTRQTGEICRRQRRSDYVERCKDYVSVHYREKIRMDEIAKTLGISRTYLSKLFSKEEGMSFQEYLIRYRVERAANLLRYSGESLAGISDYVNFPNQSYFGEKFRKYMGTTPSEYRKKFKPAEF